MVLRVEWNFGYEITYDTTHTAKCEETVVRARAHNTPHRRHLMAWRSQTLKKDPPSFPTLPILPSQNSTAVNHL